MALRFFVDHCVPRSVAEALRQDGHEVVLLGEVLPTDAPDPVVVAEAQKQAAILVSLNGDFADIVSYPPARYGGIIGLQVRNHPEVMGQVLRRLREYLALQREARHYVGKLFLVEAHRIRIRR